MPPPSVRCCSSIPTTVNYPWHVVGAFTLLTGLMGGLLAIPMKRQMINLWGGTAVMVFPSLTSLARDNYNIPIASDWSQG